MFVQVDAAAPTSGPLQAVPGVTQVAASETRGTDELWINSETGRDTWRELASTIVRQGWGLLNQPLRMSLEEIFLPPHDGGDGA